MNLPKRVSQKIIMNRKDRGDIFGSCQSEIFPANSRLKMNDLRADPDLQK